MADTIRDEAALQALFADNTTRSISPQKIRDFLVSVPSLASTANLALAGGTMTGDVLFSTNNARDVGSSAARARMLYTVGTTTDFIYGGSSPFNWIGYGNATDCTVMVGGSGPFGVKTRSGGMYGWVASGALVAGAAIDTALARNAAGVVEVTNGTAGTYRDLTLRHMLATSIRKESGGSTSYWSFGYHTSALQMASAVLVGWGSSYSSMDVAFGRNADGVVEVNNGSTGGGALQFIEMTAPAAPATNAVRIFAEDNGSGKTRLMARFATGAVQQLAIEP